MVWRRMAAAVLLITLMAVTAMSGCPPRNGHPGEGEGEGEGGCPQSGDPLPMGHSNYSVCVLNTYPHDPDAFTQGLVYADGVFYEGTGQLGESSLRRVEIETGTVLAQQDLGAQYFGEGIAVMGDRIFQLTWQNRRGFVYDKYEFTLRGTFTYTGEGWGLTHDGERLIMSDGTAKLRFLDPDTFEEIGSVTVRDGSTPVTRLNELEYIGGEVFANVWFKDYILRIDPETGTVLGRIDCSGLLTPAEALSADVLNGIAFDPETNRLWITGKYWPKVFEIGLVPVEQDAE